MLYCSMVYLIYCIRLDARVWRCVFRHGSRPRLRPTATATPTATAYGYGHAHGYGYALTVEKAKKPLFQEKLLYRLYYPIRHYTDCIPTYIYAREVAYIAK